MTLIIAKLKGYYDGSAYILGSTVILFIMSNVVLGIAFFCKDRIVITKDPVETKVTDKLESQELFNSDGAPLNNGKRSSYQIQWFDYTAYEQIVDEGYAGAVLDDFFQLSQLGFIYQPWVQFSEPPYSGQMVNIDLDSKGFPIRRTVNPPIDQSPVFRIFTLGGSTTFGYNVSDEHTWPSFLSNILNERAKSAGLNIRIEVVNYGRAFYGTSQELVLLITLLKAGLSPNLLIFMDGVNCGTPEDVPYFTDKIERIFHDRQFATPFIKLVFNHLKWMPVIRLGYSLNRKFVSKTDPDVSENRQVFKNLQAESKKLVSKFHTNWRIISQISKMNETKVLFFLQPNAFYNYPIELYRLSLLKPAQEYRRYHQEFYNQMKAADGFIDLSDLFQVFGDRRKAIIDDAHYSPNFNRFLAQQVADHTDLTSLVTRTLGSADSENIGVASPIGALSNEN